MSNQNSKKTRFDIAPKFCDSIILNNDENGDADAELPPPRRSSAERIRFLRQALGDSEVTESSKRRKRIEFLRQSLTLNSNPTVPDRFGGVAKPTNSEPRRSVLRDNGFRRTIQRDLYSKIGTGVDVCNAFLNDKNARALSTIFNEDDFLDEDDESSTDDDTIEIENEGTQRKINEEMLPLTNSSNSYYSDRRISGTKNESKKTSKEEKKRRRKAGARFKGLFSCYDFFKREIFRLSFCSTVTFVALPSLLTAAILSYTLNNPAPDSLEYENKQTSLSWCFIFLARLSITFELANLIQMFFVEGLALRSKWAVQLFGPLLTLSLIQNKGWTLILIFWPLINLFTLHGDDPFQKCWFCSILETPLKVTLFSNDNPGGQFLNSEFYENLLFSILLIGVAHVIKRTLLAIYFGKETVLSYKARQDKLLADILLITEVGQLADELEYQDGSSINSGYNENNAWNQLLGVDYNKSNKKRFSMRDSLASVNSVMFNATDMNAEIEFNESRRESFAIPETNATKSQGFDERPDSFKTTSLLNKNLTPAIFENPNCDSARNSLATNENSNNIPKNQQSLKLEPWAEPGAKSDKTNSVSISDILKFHKAWAFLNDPHNPLFSIVGGAFQHRNELVIQAQSTYQRLVEISEIETLNFDVINLLAIDQNNTIDEAKQTALHNLFLPDFGGKLSLLQFVHTYDQVYMRSRIYRASFLNTTVLNDVLGGIVNNIVWLLLVLLVLAIMQYNPYPFLVSVSSLMVTFAFAVGPSASKWVQGILMIAISRPYDIGDRIAINTVNSAPGDTFGEHWLVEDINLTCTSLRHAVTNKLATLDNGSIASMRIINYNRSPNALINMNFKICLSSTTTKKVKALRQKIEEFIIQRPRSFVSLVYLRCDDLNTEEGWASFHLRVRHRFSWQAGNMVMKDRAEFLWYCKDTCKEIGIHYKQNVTYFKFIDDNEGEFKNGKDRMKILAEQL